MVRLARLAANRLHLPGVRHEGTRLTSRDEGDTRLRLDLFRDTYISVLTSDMDAEARRQDLMMCVCHVFAMVSPTRHTTRKKKEHDDVPHRNTDYYFHQQPLKTNNYNDEYNGRY